MILAILLLIQALILSLGLFIAYLILKEIIQQVEDGKKYIEVKKLELEKFVKEKQDFVDEKQAFVQDVEDRIRNSKIGSFLNL